jgi:hypothetical protein
MFHLPSYQPIIGISQLARVQSICTLYRIAFLVEIRYRPTTAIAVKEEAGEEFCH